MYNGTNEIEFVNNRLLCSFTILENIDTFVDDLISKYDVTNKKIFILAASNNEYACTYNIETANASHIPDNTVMVHRKKETNSLYTINAINTLIKTLNNGIVDKNYAINWNEYKNSILLTQNNEFKQLKTKLFRVIFL